MAGNLERGCFGPGQGRKSGRGLALDVLHWCASEHEVEVGFGATSIPDRAMITRMVVPVLDRWLDVRMRSVQNRFLRRISSCCSGTCITLRLAHDSPASGTTHRFLEHRDGHIRTLTDPRHRIRLTAATDSADAEAACQQDADQYEDDEKDDRQFPGHDVNNNFPVYLEIGLRPAIDNTGSV